MQRHEEFNVEPGTIGVPVPAPRVGPYEASLIESHDRAALMRRMRRRARRRRIGILVVTVVAILAVSLGLGSHFLGLQPTGGSDGPAPAAQSSSDGGPNCQNPTTLKVNVPEAIATTFAALAEAYRSQPGVPCVKFTITTRAPSIVAQSIAWPDRPDAWVIDAPVWLDQANRRAGLHLAGDVPFATSPIVVAMKPAAAEAAANHGWSELAASKNELVLPEPTHSTVGLYGLVAASEYWSRTQLRSAADFARRNGERSLLDVVRLPQSNVITPVSMAELAAFNAANPATALAAVHPADGVATLEYSIVLVTETNPGMRAVLKSLRDFLATDEAGEIVTRNGFTFPSGKPLPTITSGPVRGTAKVVAAPSATEIAAARQAWAEVARPPQAVIALDVSSTSLSTVGGETVLELIRRSTQRGLAALPEGSTVALWAFGQHLGGEDQDHKVLAPSDELTEPSQVQSVARALASLKALAGGDRGLYDTIVAAQAAARAESGPDRANSAIIITSGANEDDAGLSLGETRAAVAAVSDANRDLELVIIGVGPKADARNLSSIADSAGGTYVAVSTADDLLRALQKALNGRR